RPTADRAARGRRQLRARAATGAAGDPARSGAGEVRIVPCVRLGRMAIDAAPSDVAVRPRSEQTVLERGRGDGAAPSTAVPTAPSPARVPAEGGWGVPLAVLIVGMFMSILDIS